ncbi:hypothetical protein [Paenibacillus gallinarum]|uniref:Lipoprotein n=1 Tax=Paenibacillus gallinarum TaxID=2762232 RepID=A0ABR8T607_9BACL|nr:hypothetical protein [Paenibacillus gallinarum]MBD7971025.1 hypothetical protein [Paenibacillus gallinarum]
MNKLKRKAALVLLTTVLVIGCSNTSTDALSQKRIQELRKDYPISMGTAASVNTRDVPFNEILDFTDSVIVAEVVNQVEDVSVELPAESGTPEGNLAEKDRVRGIEPYKPTFISYEVTVDEVIVGDEVKDTVNIMYNSELSDMEPHLKSGMKIITAVKKRVGSQQEGSYTFTRYGTYYIVDNHYVLSAFESESEEISSFTNITNGRTINNLKNEIKKLWK